jgi:hypothetical protein
MRWRCDRTVTAWSYDSLSHGERTRKTWRDSGTNAHRAGMEAARGPLET